MYRAGVEYDRMAQLAFDIIIDYNIVSYPLDMKDLVKRMGFNLIPYSSYGENTNHLKLLMIKSKDGFVVPRSNESEACIYYNDIYGDHLTPARISHTLGHELKHILENDKDDSEDDLCDYFSKVLRCPISYVIYLGLKTPAEVISYFDISYEQATYVINNVENRKRKYKNKYFEYEIPLLEQLVGDDFDVTKIDIIGN